MISTVTTSTVSTITSVLSTVTGLTAAMALVAVVSFLLLVIWKEAVSTTGRAQSGAVARGLNIGMVPLGLAFVIIAGTRLLAALS